ncbi:guanine nucleotide exchange factor for Rab-3A [Silurus asotus]|uniref:Guanine nucleotide exchange factor for Rab-3A n=1 Tax=Silurus asotus TaxID=30991 RepID=A0AAD5FFG7_SILAS|nr:guanine nucleotide exchange factor for Rab-3A [Silurus asotus]
MDHGSTPSPGYELLVTGSKGIALYSSHVFFGKEDSSEDRRNNHSRVKECPVGRLIDLEADLDLGTKSGRGGRGETMLQEDTETETERRVSRLRSSSIEIREKGTEFLREQLDAAQKVQKKTSSHECNVLYHRVPKVRTNSVNLHFFQKLRSF